MNSLLSMHSFFVESVNDASIESFSDGTLIEFNEDTIYETTLLVSDPITMMSP